VWLAPTEHVPKIVFVPSENFKLRRTTMKRIVSAFLALAVSAALVVVATNWKHSPRAVHAQSGCSVATLTGNYGVSWQGFDILIAGTHAVPWAGVGVLSVDGKGNVTITFTSALNGKISTGATGAGSYTVNPDCTGSLSFTSGDAAGETANIVIVGGGTEVLALSTLTTQTIMLDAKKQ